MCVVSAKCSVYWNRNGLYRVNLHPPVKNVFSCQTWQNAVNCLYAIVSYKQRERGVNHGLDYLVAGHFVYIDLSI